MSSWLRLASTPAFRAPENRTTARGDGATSMILTRLSSGSGAPLAASAPGRKQPHAYPIRLLARYLDRRRHRDERRLGRLLDWRAHRESAAVAIRTRDIA